MGIYFLKQTLATSLHWAQNVESEYLISIKFTQLFCDYYNRSPSVSWRPYLTGGFCWSKIFFSSHALANGRQYIWLEEGAGILFVGVTYSASNI